MKPYYEHKNITIWNCDCREILPTLPKVDLVLTDPPYGIGATNGIGKYGRFKQVGSTETWDERPADVSMLLSFKTPAIIWGGNYFTLPPSRNWLIWDKGAGFKGRDFAECELAWCSVDGNAKVFSYDPLAGGDYRAKFHPTMKPLALIKWCFSFFPKAQSVLDPFMGSGTTLVAAKELGLSAIGIELEERYCEIAANRLRQEVFDFAGAESK